MASLPLQIMTRFFLFLLFPCIYMLKKSSLYSHICTYRIYLCTCISKHNACIQGNTCLPIVITHKFKFQKRQSINRKLIPCWTIDRFSPLAEPGTRRLRESVGLRSSRSMSRPLDPEGKGEGGVEGERAQEKEHLRAGNLKEGGD